MLDHEDLKWIASTSTNLNSILQQIARYTDLARRHKGQHTYLDLLGERVELGAKTAQTLFDKVTGTILAQTAAKSGVTAQPIFTVVPPPPVGAVPVHATAAVSASGEAREPAFHTDFPQKSKGAETAVPHDIKIRNPKGNREYILIVEDDSEIAELAAGMLADEGYKIILARDGFEALEIYRKVGRQIALVILDFFLPVMDGDAVYDELREVNPAINVVLSSGFAEQEKISAMLAQGLRGFIPKPYTKERLLEQVRTALDAARQGLR
jgi:CheY-like chemotaxis protein